MTLEFRQVKALRDLLDYCREEERKHYEQMIDDGEGGSAKHHIYKSIVELDRAIDAHDK